MWQEERERRIPWFIICAAFGLIAAIVILKEAGASDTDTDYLSMAVLIAALAFASTLDRRMGLLVALLAGLIAAIVPGGATFFHEPFLDALFRPIVLAAMSMSFYRVIVVLRDREDHLARQLHSLQLLHEEVTTLHAMSVHKPADRDAVALQIARAVVRLGAGTRSRLLMCDPTDDTWEVLAQWPPRAPQPMPALRSVDEGQSPFDITEAQPFSIMRSQGGDALITVPFSSGDGVYGALQVERDLTARNHDEYGRLLAVYARDAALTLEHIALQRQLEHLAVLGERGRIARDMHDGLVQSLAGIAFHLEYYRDELGPENVTVREGFDAMATAVKDALHEARSMIHELRSKPAPDNLGAMIESLVDSIALRTDLAISAEIPQAPLPLLSPQVDALVYIAREALQNVVKHAAATRVWLSVGLEEQGVVLRIVDDGCGFTPAHMTAHESPAHFGLVGMVERAEAHGGRVAIESNPGIGTTVSLVFPSMNEAGSR